jgi:hypothetical protein
VALVAIAQLEVRSCELRGSLKSLSHAAALRRVKLIRANPREPTDMTVLLADTAARTDVPSPNVNRASVDGAATRVNESETYYTIGSARRPSDDLL